MKKCEFSESQFVVGYMAELIPWYNSLYPLWRWFMPTTAAEWRTGADVIVRRYRYSEFYQFKRSHYYDHRVFSSLSPGGTTVNTGTTPHYGFKIYNNSTSKQFDTLQQLARKQRTQVYYCAPLFHTIPEFRRNHRNGQIRNSSILIDMSDPNIQGISVPYNSTHRMLYTNTQVHICSEIINVEKFYTGETKPPPPEYDNNEDKNSESFNVLMTELKNIVMQDMEENNTPMSEYLDVPEYIRSYLAANLNIHWFPRFEFENLNIKVSIE